MANARDKGTHSQENAQLDHLLGNLFPEIIYGFNKVLIPSWKADKLGHLDGKKAAYFTASFFSSHTRTFHWVSIDLDLWNPDDTKAIDAINKLTEELRSWYWDNEWHDKITNEKIEIEDRKAAWQALLEDLPQGRLYDVARGSIEAVIQNKGQFSGNSAAQRTMLGLYSGHHHPADKNVEGIFYRFLSRCGNRCQQPATGDLDYLLGELTNGSAGNTAPPFAWFKPEHECKNCKMSAPLKAWENVRDQGASRDDEPMTCDMSRSPSQALIEQFFMGLLGNLNSFATELASRRFTALVPIYDVWIGNRGYGGIKAVILNFFSNTDERNKWVASNFLLLRKALPSIADEIAVTGETMAISQPISPPYDLLRQFLKILTFVQDWESASVVDTETSKILYRFYREQNKNEAAKWDWIREENPVCGVGNPSKEVLQDGARWIMWWTTDLWSEDFIPGIGGEELGRFERVAIRFEFPDACHIPPATSDRNLLRRMYIRQQLSLMRVLLPKVRARRAALRSAVSAIMGRNMSHNIGSHVIARYASKARNDRRKTGEDKADHRGDFLAYLQRRMDFLAEVATSDQAFWSQPLSLGEQVNRLNYAVQQKRFVVEKTLPNNGRCPVDADCAHHLSPKAKTDQGAAPPNDEEPQRPILLSFITGKESLLASVEYGKPGALCNPGDAEPPADCCLGYKTEQPHGDHLFFACPGGEVGAHALYVILENVIRNSARHGGESRDTVRVFVSAVNSPDDADCLLIELIDPRTKLTKNGCLLSCKENDSAAGTQNDKLAELKTCSLLDKNGKRITLYSLPKNINSILSDEPFLDDAGVPNPNYWGVREMQICAHYLRNSELSDLEGVQHQGAPVLEADVHHLAKDEWCLMYRFRLQRPKLLAAVVLDGGKFKERANSLRSKGVVVLAAPKPDDCVTGWYELSEAARDYSFLVVENEVELPTDGTPSRVALPVRTFRMEGSELAPLIDRAYSSPPSQWVHELHERVAKQYQEKRTSSWATKKPLYGVVLGRDKLTQEGCLPKTPPLNGGLFWADAKDVKGRDEPVGPLPAILECWHNSLSDKSIAAIWVDHPGKFDFDDNWGKLALASEKPLAEGGGPMWISAEGAFSDSLHTAYLNELCSPESQATAGAAQRISPGQELLAAALSRVVVLDERVQSELNRDARSGLPLSNMWPLMGVWVPKRTKDAATEDASLPSCDLDMPCFDAIQKFLKEPARRSDQYPVDFLVIHLTILERLKENSGKGLPELLEQLRAGTHAEKAEVIIVTGRGVPSMARKLNEEHLEAARFLPISALLECLVLRPSKLALMRVLWSAGRPPE